MNKKKAFISTESSGDLERHNKTTKNHYNNGRHGRWLNNEGYYHLHNDCIIYKNGSNKKHRIEYRIRISVCLHYATIYNNKHDDIKIILYTIGLHLGKTENGDYNDATIGKSDFYHH
jgi:hypothetical protein